MTTDSISVEFPVQSWRSRSFEPAEISTVQSENLSGILKVGELWSLIVSGQHVVTAHRDDGDWVPLAPDDMEFTAEDAKLYESPDDESAALLACRVAQADSGDTYYTEDQPIDQIDELLEEQSFDGYIKMDENTMTGTHYISYVDGDRYVFTDANTADEPLTGDEAYTRMCSEVAIYLISETTVHTDIDYFQRAESELASSQQQKTDPADDDGDEPESSSQTNTDTDTPQHGSQPAETQPQIDATTRLDNIEAAVSQLEAKIDELSSLLQTTAVSDSTQHSLTPRQAIENTRLSIRPKLGKADSEEDMQAETKRPRKNIIPIATLDTENTTVEDTSYEDFIRGTVEHQFVEWISSEFYSHIERRGAVNLPGVEQMVSQMRQIVFRDTLENNATSGSETSYDAVIYGKNGEPTGIVTQIDADREGRISDIRKTIGHLQPVADSNTNMLNVFVLSSSGFSPGICPEMQGLTEEKGIMKREDRDALVKSDDGGEMHVCLLEVTKTEFFVVYPEKQIDTSPP